MLWSGLTILWIAALAEAPAPDPAWAAPARIEVLTPVLAAEAPILRLRCVADRERSEGVSAAAVRVAGRWFALGDLAAGVAAEVDVRTALAGLPEETHTRVPLCLCYETAGSEALLETFVIAAREPESAVPPGALAKVVGHNTTDAAEANAYITAFVPDVAAPPEGLSVRSADSEPLPSLVEPADGGVVVHTLVDIPARYARCLYLCPGREPAAPSDLTVEPEALGTGAGTVRVATAHFSLTLSEAAGACVTELTSKATGLDYAALSFGGARAEGPAREEESAEADHRGLLRVEAGESGAVAARVVAVGWAGGARLEQTYTFVAGKPWFLLRSRVDAEGADGEEVILVEARLRGNGLTEIVATGRRGGWGESPGRGLPGGGTPNAPSVISFLGAPGRAGREGWSIGVLGGEGLSGARYAPRAEDPIDGERESCVQAQLLADPTRTEHGGVSVSCVVLLHGGGLSAARDSIEPLRTPRFVTARPLP